MQADEAASVRTRPAKDRALTPGLLRDRWEAEADSVRLLAGDELLDAVRDRTGQRRGADAVRVRELFAHLVDPRGRAVRARIALWRGAGRGEDRRVRCRAAQRRRHRGAHRGVPGLGRRGPPGQFRPLWEGPGAVVNGCPPPRRGRARGSSRRPPGPHSSVASSPAASGVASFRGLPRRPRAAGWRIGLVASPMWEIEDDRDLRQGHVPWSSLSHARAPDGA